MGQRWPVYAAKRAHARREPFTSRGRAQLSGRVCRRMRIQRGPIAGTPHPTCLAGRASTGRQSRAEKQRRRRGARTVCLAHLAERLGVGSALLSNADDDVDESSVVLQPLLRAPRLLLLLLLLGDLWRLAAHLAGTGQRSVNLACGYTRGAAASARRSGVANAAPAPAGATDAAGKVQARQERSIPMVCGATCDDDRYRNSLWNG